LKEVKAGIDSGKLNITTTPKKEDPTASTGLRHRRNIAAKDMAEELQNMAKVQGGSGGGGRETGHQRMKTGATYQDNLLAGMNNILAMQEKHDARADDRHHEDQPTGAASDHYDGDESDDAPHDEETGGAPKNSTATTKYDNISPPSSFQRRHAERIHNLRIWYHDLIEPKFPHFIKATTHSILFIIVPLLAVAFILYYGLGNPIAGGTEVVDDEGEEHASWSWWVLLILRQIIVLLCVKGGEVISIDIL
jgi:hypothetical protein